MKKTITLVALSLPLLASAATNLLLDGSFENALVGWTSTGAGASYPVAVISYGAPGSAFGEVVPTDSSASLSPDAVGTHAAYFVEDSVTETLSQTFTLASSGTYVIGYSTYVPANGFANPNNSLFSTKVDSTTLQSTSVGALPATTWQAQSFSTVLSAGTHTVTFSFAPNGSTSKDLVLDRVFVTAAVPEPETYALMLAGLAAIGFVARRRRS